MNADEPQFPHLVATILRALEHTPGNEALLTLLNSLTLRHGPIAGRAGLFLVGSQDHAVARIS